MSAGSLNEGRPRGGGEPMPARVSPDISKAGRTVRSVPTRPITFEETVEGDWERQMIVPLKPGEHFDSRFNHDMNGQPYVFAEGTRRIPLSGPKPSASDHGAIQQVRHALASFAGGEVKVNSLAVEPTASTAPETATEHHGIVDRISEIVHIPFSRRNRNPNKRRWVGPGSHSRPKGFKQDQA